MYFQVFCSGETLIALVAGVWTFICVCSHVDQHFVTCIESSLWSCASLPPAVEESVSVCKRMCACDVRGKSRHAREVRAAPSPLAHSLRVLNRVSRRSVGGRSTRRILIFKLWWMWWQSYSSREIRRESLGGHPPWHPTPVAGQIRSPSRKH